MEYRVKCPNCNNENIFNIEEKEFIIQFNCAFCGYLIQYDGKKIKKELDILKELERERKKWSVR